MLLFLFVSSHVGEQKSYQLQTFEWRNNHLFPHTLYLKVDLFTFVVTVLLFRLATWIFQDNTIYFCLVNKSMLSYLLLMNNSSSTDEHCVRTGGVHQTGPGKEQSVGQL